jgi:hypothetical protein
MEDCEFMGVVMIRRCGYSVIGESRFTVDREVCSIVRNCDGYVKEINTIVFFKFMSEGYGGMNGIQKGYKLG